MPRWLLIMLLGILLLTIVDGAYLVAFSSYSTNQYTHSSNKSDNKSEEPEGPIFSVFIESLDVIESFIAGHEKTLIVLSTIAIAAFTYTLWRATTGLFEMAKQQARDMEKSISIAKKSSDAAWRQASTLISSERGYAKISHCHPLILEDTISSVRFKMEIKNWGRTPIQVTGVLLFPYMLDSNKSLPIEPPYDAHERMAVHAHALLMSQEPFFFFQNVVAGIDYRGVQDGSKILYLIGCLDYTDKFGIKRRGGYARKYIPEERDLVFVTQEHYNYDRNRKEGEELPS